MLHDDSCAEDIEHYTGCCRYAETKIKWLVKTNAISDALAFHLWRNVSIQGVKPETQRLQTIRDMLSQSQTKNCKHSPGS